ncbi:MAG TPA: Hsp70 family protein [Candidatus Binataceae bacterium]|nr:Hsp70 family protein [Candidatus Binataceae bacterium]
MPSRVDAVGLDFGTTNSAIAIVAGDGTPLLARFKSALSAAPDEETFRSILFFEATEETGGTESAVAVGNDAIRRYLGAGGNGRLVQSLKSFLAVRSFETTDIMGEDYSLGDLVAPILVALRTAAEAQFGPLPPRIVVGRPVHFSDARTPADDDFAEARLDVAIRRAGWDDITFEYEPVAAAYDYASRITRDEIVLIGDFGGGTSDFSVLRLRPAGAAGNRYEILGNDGVALAGDAFDGRMMHHVVAPALGRGTRYKTPYGTVLPVPTWPYTRLERWHHLSMLANRSTLFRLRELQRDALEPAKIGALVHVIENDQGYYLFRSVEKTKVDLSSAESAEFGYSDPPVEIARIVGRSEFESWVAHYLEEIERCVDRLMQAVSIEPRQIDSVFLTGGSSFVPAVRRIFTTRFGPDRIHLGNEFTSVARGLALRALER